jgi:hypothetical protein
MEIYSLEDGSRDCERQKGGFLAFNISDSFTRIAMTLNERLVKTPHFVEIYQSAILLEGTLFVQSMNHNSSTFSTTISLP